MHSYWSYADESLQLRWKAWGGLGPGGLAGQSLKTPASWGLHHQLGLDAGRIPDEVLNECSQQVNWPARDTLLVTRAWTLEGKNGALDPCPFLSEQRITFVLVEVHKNVVLPAMQVTRVWSLCPEDPLGKGMATHSSILAWRSPWTEEPGTYSTWVHKESDMTEWLSLFQEHSGLMLGKLNGAWWVAMGSHTTEATWQQRQPCSGFRDKGSKQASDLLGHCADYCCEFSLRHHTWVGWTLEWLNPWRVVRPTVACT